MGLILLITAVKYRTKTLPNIGANANFTYDDPDNKMVLQPSTSSSTILRFAVYDENQFRADVLIGRNEKNLIEIEENKEFTFSCELFDDKLKTAG